jgi:hypothetical protein
VEICLKFEDKKLSKKFLAEMEFCKISKTLMVIGSYYEIVSLMSLAPRKCKHTFVVFNEKMKRLQMFYFFDLILLLPRTPFV